MAVEYCWEVVHTVTPSDVCVVVVDEGTLFNQLCLCAVISVILTFIFPIIMTGEYLSDEVEDHHIRDGL